jgi:hypothetical protein
MSNELEIVVEKARTSFYIFFRFVLVYSMAISSRTRNTFLCSPSGSMRFAEVRRNGWSSTLRRGL